jgi:uncharacterized Zn finger protein (UPF0148 family)
MYSGESMPYVVCLNCSAPFYSASREAARVCPVCGHDETVEANIHPRPPANGARDHRPENRLPRREED